MTQHTTQDSQSELDKILDTLDNYNVAYRMSDIKLLIKPKIEAYVTTRVKEAERLARISERKSVALDNYSGHTFSEDTNWEGKFQKFIDNNERRIEALTTTTNGKEG